MIRYLLPRPPPTNNLYANVHGIGRVKTGRYSDWRKLAGYELLGQGKKKIEGLVSVSIAVTRPDRRKRDLDGLVKPLLDLLTEMQVIEDDSLVQRLSIQWVDDASFECSVLIQASEEAIAA